VRVLFVTPRLPYPPMSGFRTRVYQMLRHLAGRHEVALLTFARSAEAQDVEALRGYGIEVHTVPSEWPAGLRKRRMQLASLGAGASYQRRLHQSAAIQHALDRLLTERTFEMVQLESNLMSWLNLHRAAPVVLDEHNIESELLARTASEEHDPLRRLFNGLECRKVRREERSAWRKADACIFTSEREAAIVRGLLPGHHIAVVPNGVDIEYFRPTAAPPASESIVFTGLMSYRPNVDGAIWFVEEVLPHIRAARPAASFTIAGARPPREVLRLAGPGIHVTGELPDMRPVIAEAAVLVAPLRMGSGTRLKVVEGLAMGKAMVSTSLGCEGITVQDGQHLRIADSPEQFAAAVLHLLDDPAAAARLGANGRAMVEQYYGWDGIVRRLEDTYEAVRLRPAPTGAGSLMHEGAVG
jgi:polysaccharide biosynthesis protein PslH